MPTTPAQFQPPKVPWYAWPILPIVFLGALALFILLFLLMALLLVLVGIPLYLFLPRKWRPGGPAGEGANGWQQWSAHGQRSGWMGGFRWEVQASNPLNQPDNLDGKEIAVTVLEPDAKALPDKTLR
jgi:hypothetical protein